MNIVSIIFGVVASTLLGALLHLWRGGGLGKLIYYLILSWVGFWLGHIIASLLGFEFMMIGTVNFGLGVVGSLLFLGAGYWLGLVKPNVKAN